VYGAIAGVARWAWGRLLCGSVLGPVQVFDGAEPISLPPREMDVLALLAGAANQTVPVERLIDALWPAGPPRTSVKSLQVRVHGLRRALGDADRVRYRYGGYVLVVGPAELDAAEFEQLAERGRAMVAEGRADQVRRRCAGRWRRPAWSPLARAVSCASSLTSLATTAKPLPASPARYTVPRLLTPMNPATIPATAIAVPARGGEPRCSGQVGRTGRTPGV
jgi:hypothetical protein